jgi:gluconate kinase
MALTAEKFHGWTPSRIYWRGKKPFVDWSYIGKTRFTQPFFDHTIEETFRKPFNILFRHQTPLEFLGELYEQEKRLAPTGFIFHMSRCGSTLVSQMLAAVEKNIVISEPPPIDSVIRAHIVNTSVTDEQRIEWLRWIVGALGQPRNGEKYYFIKFDSWSAFDLDLIRRAFPDVPWIFLYRNPVEVIVSQMRLRGAYMIPGKMENMLPGADFDEILRMPPEEYCARILARICLAALDCAGTRGALMINYDQLPGAVTSIITKHFGAEFTPAEIERMKSAARFNAKKPSLFFEPDAETKRKEANEAARRAAEKWLDPLYEQLENIRLRK